MSGRVVRKDLVEALIEVAGEGWSVQGDAIVKWRSHAVPETVHTIESAEAFLRSYADELREKLATIQHYFNQKEAKDEGN